MLATAIGAMVATPGQAREFEFIRDAEVENTIRAYATPVFQAAGLDPQNVRVYLIKDGSLNAFVAGGQNMFINTGLLVRAENPNQVMGVIAHETGHIVGGHLSRTQDAMKNATAQSILAMVLGGAVAVGAGRGDVGAAAVMAGQNVGLRSFLAYSQTQESSADQSACRTLEQAGISPKGLVDFMEILAGQDLLRADRQDPYLRSHPLSLDRVQALRQCYQESRYATAPTPPTLIEQHKRMQAKLLAFIENSARTFRRYKEDDPSLEARYARAIAYHRSARLDLALPEIDGLIKDYPKDPYFHELKGQILFENGRPAEALEPYRTANRLLPNSPLLLVSLAHVELESQDPALIKPAVEHLRAATRLETDDPGSWRMLSVAYARDEQPGPSALALAEEAYLTRKRSEALFYATRAEKLLPRGSPQWLRAQDIIQSAKIEKDREKN